jgi:mannose-6-phosphate isomerase
MLYPLKFKPIVKERIWGGTRIADRFGKGLPIEAGKKYGESWEISAVQDSISIVSNGFLAGNTLEEIVEVYMGDIVGEKVYRQFGIEFPLLVKLIDTAEFLSVQVHPDNEMAARLHHAFGKSELWYVLECYSDSKIITGFNKELSRNEYVELLNSGKLNEFLRFEGVSKDDFFFIPARRVHSIGQGILLVEIQQTSDITYRIYDWDRTDENGVSRELHTQLALDAIDFSLSPLARKHEPITHNEPQELIKCPFFNVNRVVIDREYGKNLFNMDSFIIYLCVEGQVAIESEGNQDVTLLAGELALIPAALDSITLIPSKESKLLEVFY